MWGVQSSVDVKFIPRCLCWTNLSIYLSQKIRDCELHKTFLENIIDIVFFVCTKGELHKTFLENIIDWVFFGTENELHKTFLENMIDLVFWD